MATPAPSLQSLGRLWFDRLRVARIRYECIRTAASAGTVDVQVENVARAEYEKVLAAFADLIVHRKLPE